MKHVRKLIKLPDNTRKLFEIMDLEGNFDALLDHSSEDVVFQATIRGGTPISGVFSGIIEVTRYFKEVLPGVAEFRQLQPLEFITGKESVVVLGNDEYTVLANGKRYNSPYSMVLKIEDALITNILIIQDLSVIWEAYQRPQ